MTKADKIKAARALIDWFISQEIDESSACDLMVLVIAGIVHSVSGNDASKRVEGAEVVKQAVLDIMREG